MRCGSKGFCGSVQKIYPVSLREVAVGSDLKRPEAPTVAIHELAIAKVNDYPRVRCSRRLSLVGLPQEPERAGHPEVNEERAATIELEREALPVTANLRHHSSHQPLFVDVDGGIDD
jgi:hypothetical protein